MQAERSLAHSLRQRAVAARGSVLLETSRTTDTESHTYLFTEPVEEVVAFQLEDIVPALHRIDEVLQQNHYVAGFLSYEAGFAFEPALAGKFSATPTLPLLWFGVYREPEISLPFVNEVNTVEEKVTSELRLAISQPEYMEKVEAIREFIARGDTYQANFTTSVSWKNTQDAASLFRHMMHAQPVEFGALINLGDTQILSASPELFFLRYGDHIETRPMKGTAPRGRTTVEDAAMQDWLRHDEKNRAENLMIVDLLRNDLGRICTPGSVKVSKMFHVEQFASLFQMTSTVTGIIKDGTTYSDIFRALFPSGSIVGAPKIHTMEILRELEQQERGVYTGAIGFIAPDKRAIFNVAIRTVVLKDGDASMGVGSGIVYDSDPQSEYNECLTKTSFLTRPTQDFQLIETMLWDRSFTFLEEHMDRLRDSAAYFGFTFDKYRILNELHAFSHRFGCNGRQRVRLLLHQDGSVAITSTELPSESDTSSVRVLLHSQHTDPGDRFLFHKTTRRRLYDEALKEAQELHCADAIFLNKEGKLTEGSIHNFVLAKDGVWSTPHQRNGLLAGIYRKDLLQRGKVVEADLTMKDLLHAEEIYLCNSVRGLRQVEQLLRRTSEGRIELLWNRDQRQVAHTP